MGCRPLWGLFLENWPRYNGTALYLLTKVILATVFLTFEHNKHCIICHLLHEQLFVDWYFRQSRFQLMWAMIGWIPIATCRYTDGLSLNRQLYWQSHSHHEQRFRNIHWHNCHRPAWDEHDVGIRYIHMIFWYFSDILTVTWAWAYMITILNGIWSVVWLPQDNWTTVSECDHWPLLLTWF